MFVDDPAGATTLPNIAVVPEIGPVARFMRRVLGWPNPFNSVSICIIKDDHLMIVYTEPKPDPVDWVIAEDLMHRIAHPSHFRRTPELIRDVDMWDIRRVSNASDALQRFLDSQAG